MALVKPMQKEIKTMNSFFKVLGAISFLTFSFLVFVSFNPGSASVILNGMLVGSEFYQKTQNAMLFLMLYLIFTPLQFLVLHLLLKENRQDLLKKFLLYFLIFSVLLSMVVYYFAGVHPFSLPVVSA
jgi:pheromone shutdown protein TraB